MYRNKKEFTEPQELIIGFDLDTGKNDTVQYVPILRTLRLLLSHKDVLGEVYKGTTEHTEGVTKSYKDGEMWGENALFTSDELSLQLILYHDDFKVVSPLGNKVVKYKSSAFYFVLGNIPSKLRSRLCDINSVMIFPATLISKYGYQLILQPILEDLEKFETSGIKVVVEGRSTIFRGILSMVIAENLAAHAPGGFFCNFSTVNHFCRNCNFSKVMLGNKFKSTEFVMRILVEGYQNSVNIIDCDPDSASVYGLKSNSCLNSFTYFYVISGLPPVLAHDVFAGVALDVIFHVLLNFVNEGVLTINETNDYIS